MKLLRILNVDTAIGAVSFVFVASVLRNVEIGFFVYFELFVSVLFIYNLDHLIDAFKLKDSKSSIRHLFYKNNFKSLIAWQLVMLVIGLWGMLKLPSSVILAGLLMAFFMGVYFLLIFRSNTKTYLLREVVVALGYTIAVLFVPFADSLFSTEASFYSFVLIVFFTALTNLWVFALFDTEIDKHQNHHSITRKVSAGRLTRLTKLLIYATISMLIVFVFYVSWVIGTAFIIVELVYLVLIQNQSFFKNNDLYRLIGEIVLVLPGLALLLQYAI